MAKQVFQMTKVDLRKLSELAAAMPATVDRFGRSVSSEMTGDIKASFGTSPSPVGSPPGVDTGALRASMHWTDEGRLIYHIQDGVEYGIEHELLRDKRPGLRPFISPVFQHWRNSELDKFAKSFNWI